MNPFTKALQTAVDKVSGVTRVNNAANPNSANAKMTASVGKKNINDPQISVGFKSSLPYRQKTFGVPNAK